MILFMFELELSAHVYLIMLLNFEDKKINSSKKRFLKFVASLLTENSHVVHKFVIW